MLRTAYRLTQYSSTLSYSRHCKGVSGQFHAPAALPLIKHTSNRLTAASVVLG